MQLTLKLEIPPLMTPITYKNPILLTGSCFTEHISERLQQHKFNVLSNPNGILFNPLSVADSLNSYIAGRLYTKGDLFYLNELWNSWDHHTRFSDIDADAALEKINSSQKEAGNQVKKAGWVIITLGSAFQYYLKETGKHVANNHRAPAQWFEKKLLSIEEITNALAATISNIKAVNPDAQILFTISPVRHIRDGVIENNRSKARLIESVHALCSEFSQAHYFPAYELLIDILRDYRYYDVDFVHPNFMATSYVWEQFVASCIASSDYKLMEEVNSIITAYKHRPRFPQTEAHKRFKEANAQKATDLMLRHTFLDLEKERDFFNSL